MPIAIDLGGNGTLSVRCYRALREAILGGRIRPGARLPPSRELARDLGVSRPVVVAAYEQLQAEGYVTARVGSGTYVAAELPMSLASPDPDRDTGSVTFRPVYSHYGTRVDCRVLDVPGSPFPRRTANGKGGVIDFRYALASPEFPLLLWRRLLGTRLHHARPVHLGYSDAAGLPALRRAIADHLRQYRAVRCDWEQVVIVNGSQQALDLTARLLFDVETNVALENPHYQGAREAFKAAGARLLGVPVDDHGIQVDALPVSRPVVRAVYITPSHQFPTGGVLPVARRLQLLDWARHAGACVIEDDYDGEYRYDARPMPSVQGLDRDGRVIYVGTFSRVLFPALRLAYAVVPPALLDRFVAAKWLADRQGPTLEQAVLTRFIAEGHFARHVQRSRRAFATRRDALKDAVEQHLGTRAQLRGAQAGLHAVLWLEGLAPAEADAVASRGHQHGLLLHSVTPYYLNEPLRAGLLLGYAHLSPRAIHRGVERLAQIVLAHATAPLRRDSSMNWRERDPSIEPL